MNQFCNVGKFSRLAPERPGVAGAPGWASTLQQLYAGVVEERVPGDLDKLLVRLEGSLQRQSQI